jgi:hypothetical protein
VLGILGGVSCAGCGSVVEGASSCGPSYVVHAPGRTITNTCAGIIPGPMRFSVPSGGRFSIDIGHEESGKLDFPVPAPTGPGIRVLSRQGAVITYEARVPGVTRLVARHTPYCADEHGRRVRSCDAAIVRVAAR